MRTLSPSERRALRAKAHALHPVVIVGHHGLTPTVMNEIDVSLRAHELIKIRVGNDERAAREEALARICAELDAAPVQHLGKMLVVWRPAPVTEKASPAAAADKASTTKRARPRAASGSFAGGAAMAAAAGRHRPQAGTASPRNPAARRKPQPASTEAGAGGASNRRRRRVS